MSVNQSPIFVAAPNCQLSQVTVANTGLDGTGTLVTVWTPGANGSLLSKIIVKVPGTSVADMIRLFLSDGANTRLYQEIPVSAVTPSSTVASFRTEYIPTTPEVFPTGWTLRASTNGGQTTNIEVLGGNY